MTTDDRRTRVLVVDDQPAHCAEARSRLSSTPSRSSSSATAPGWDIDRVERYLARMPGFAPRVGDAAGVLH